MSDLKPTPGPWEASCTNEHGYQEWSIRVPGEAPVISYEIAKITSYRPDGTDESDARLIAEAGTVFHETGLTPRQLVDLNAELLEALRKIAAIKNQMYGGDWEEIEEAREIANSAIAKAEAMKGSQ
jgi:hypothetical protein